MQQRAAECARNDEGLVKQLGEIRASQANRGRAHSGGRRAAVALPRVACEIRVTSVSRPLMRESGTRSLYDRATMSADAEEELSSEAGGAARATPRWLRVPYIEVRRAEGTPAGRTRPRFAWNIGEVSGSLGDLGTFLPHIIASRATAASNAARASGAAS
jgi:hypothetical protein